MSDNGTISVRGDQLLRVLTLLAERRFVLEEGRGDNPWRVLDTMTEDDRPRVAHRGPDEKAAVMYRQWLIQGAVQQMLESLKVETGHGETD